ncbi:MAG: N-acetyltransferase [Roseiflexus castenholzii]|uniref:GNAT family N-acetyltransferase n=1 Tax=Roseiflexus castenholzii TaxID=120962 RepID=UPI000CB9445C|nr:MAG: N-acetyltransferase [Roseiflexus castenholzii]
MEIRVATAADAQALAWLNATFNGVQMSPQRMAEQLARCSGIESALIAYHGDDAIGFACLRLIPWLCYDVMYAELTELFVVEAFRRRGVASALVARAERMARAAGATELRILTGRDNVAAQAFYQTLGYEDEDEMLMIRHL